MSDYEIDLDALAPQVKHIKLSGKILEVHPPKFKNLLRIMAVAEKLQSSGGQESFTILDELRQELIPAVPGLADKDIDISLGQLGELVAFLMKIATPTDLTIAEKQYDGDEKKTESGQVS